LPGTNNKNWCIEAVAQFCTMAETFFSIFFKANPADFTTVKKGIKVLSWLT